VTAIAVMTIAGKRGGEATARQQQGNGKAKARQQRGDGDVKAIGYGASVGKVD
jgi:ribosomal protein L25 (general stress protein Ctc)